MEIDRVKNIYGRSRFDDTFIGVKHPEGGKPHHPPECERMGLRP